MKATKNILALLFFIIFYLSKPFYAQTTTVNGYITDTKTGEIIIGAIVYDNSSKVNAVSNVFGYYSISLPKADTNTTLICTCIGYTTQNIRLATLKNNQCNYSLLPNTTILSEVTVSEKKSVKDNSISMVVIPLTLIKKLPSIMGEADVIRSYQLMPGVQGGKEGTSGLFIRGGSPDQNLFLVDDIPLYYVNHIGGFVSVFDINSINNITLYKAGFPSRYGGRLSAVMDIRLKDGNNQKIKGNYTFGVLSNKLNFEGPITKKTTFLVTGRRSLFDLFSRLITRMNSNGKFGGGYTFYDVTGKIAHQIDEKNKLFFSIYNGGDKIFLRSKEDITQGNNSFNYKYNANINWGNFLTSVRWNHIYSPKLFSNTTLGYTNFYYKNKLNAVEKDNASNKITRAYKSVFSSTVKDVICKSDYYFYPNINNNIKFGGEATYHTFNPGIAVEQFSYQSLADSSNKKGSLINAYEGKIYIEDEIILNSRLSLNAGIHSNTFYINNTNFFSLQPRLLLTYKLPLDLLFKAAYSNMQQNIHLLSNSGAGLPTDLWVPATKIAKPEKSNQYVVGINKTLNLKFPIELSVEGYYKDFTNLIELKEGESFFSTNKNWENKVEVNGKGKVYGAEFLIQKKEGSFTGWVGYTISKNTRQFENLNQGKEFPYRYDRKHDVSVVMNYDINNNLSVSATWIFSTGQAITLPTTQYNVIIDPPQQEREFTEIDIYESRNGYRLPSYHRLDVGLNYKKMRNKGVAIWNFSVYNVYNRLNPYFLYFKTTNNNRELYQFTLFPIIPSISYTYEF
ncbi:MAG: carboxypeptidase-like regulatory domain-containing protein [Bacteroidia bacterium]